MVSPRTIALATALLLVSASQAVGDRRLLQSPTYANLLTAANTEVRIISQLYKGVFTSQNWGAKADFKILTKIAADRGAKATAFFPADDAWQRVAAYYCLTLQQVLDYLAANPLLVANYVKDHVVLFVAVPSRDFKDGKVFTTMRTGDTTGERMHTMSKVVSADGTVSWVFKGAAIFKDPVTNAYEDVIVNPQRMDIRAGNAVIHVTNTMFRNTATESFWEGKRAEALARAGMPANSRVCPP